MKYIPLIRSDVYAIDRGRRHAFLRQEGTRYRHNEGGRRPGRVHRIRLRSGPRICGTSQEDNPDGRLRLRAQRHQQGRGPRPADPHLPGPQRGLQRGVPRDGDDDRVIGQEEGQEQHRVRVPPESTLFRAEACSGGTPSTSCTSPASRPRARS